MTAPTEAIRKAHALVPIEEWINGSDDDSDYSLVGPHDVGIVSRPVVRVHSTAIADYIAACNPAAIRALLDRLDSAERALRNVKRVIGPCVPECSGCYEEWSEALRIIDAAIDEQLRSVGEKEPGVLRDGKWYWVRYEGLGKTYEAPALFRSDAEAFYSHEFSGVPAREVLVIGEALAAFEAKKAGQA